MKRKKISIKTLTFAFAMAFMMAILAVAPVQAKSVKVLTITGTKGYSKDDTGKWYMNYKSTSNYNKKGMNTGSETKYYNPNGSVYDSYKNVCTYDKKGRVKAYKFYNNNKLTSLNKLTYKGKNTITKEYNGKKKYTGKTVFTGGKSKTTSKNYDASGKLTSTYVVNLKQGRTSKSTYTSYDSNGKVSYKSITTYSYSGKNVIMQEKTSSGYKYEEKFQVGKAGISIYSYRKEYDPEGNLISNVSFRYDKYTSGKAKGCVKTAIEIVDGKEVRKTVYTVKLKKIALN